jgi:hypothetical protein
VCCTERKVERMLGGKGKPLFAKCVLCVKENCVSTGTYLVPGTAIKRACVLLQEKTLRACVRRSAVKIVTSQVRVS